MRKLIVAVLAVGSLLAAPAAALAGGWATVGITQPSPPPGSGPGDRWMTELTVLQHGMTPLAGVEPLLILTNRKTGETFRFPAEPTKETGVYAVVVELPANGTYDVSVYDGFAAYGGAQTHTFAPITVGPAAAPAATEKKGPAPASAPVTDDGSTALWPLALGVLAAALAGAVLVLARRSRRKAPAVV